jgi:hypothetical protein
MATNSTAVGIDHPTIVPTNFGESEDGRSAGSRDEDGSHAER